MRKLKSINKKILFQINTNAELLNKETLQSFLIDSLISNIYEFRIGTDMTFRPMSRFSGEQLQFIKMLDSLGLIRILYVMTDTNTEGNSKELKYIVDNFSTPVVDFDYFSMNKMMDESIQSHVSSIVSCSGFTPRKVKECKNSRIQYECNGSYRLCTDIGNFSLYEQIRNNDCDACKVRNYCDIS